MKLNVNDALSYLDLVKERFEGQGPTYITFLDVMRDFKAQVELFKDHPDLIGGFNSFIPEGYCMEGPTIQNKTSAALDEISMKAEEIETQKGRSPVKTNDNQMQYTHALQFANKVKNRFNTSPEVYRNFLKILHWYQNELKDNDLTKRQNAEKKVFKDVARLFEGHTDLLKEFNKFLPESSYVSTANPTVKRNNMGSPVYNNKQRAKVDDYSKGYKSDASNRMKRSTNYETTNSPTNNHLIKKSKISDSTRDISISDFTRIGNSTDLNILQKIHEAFRSSSLSSQNYNCLLQNIQLYNNNMIKKDDLLESCKPLFSNQHMDLWRQLKDLLNNSKSNEADKNAVQSMYEKRFDLDFSKLKKCGASYKILPHDYPQPVCSGRINCPFTREVLNDHYISFASLASEDSQFVASKKNQYEESIYRVEDERYEVDMVVELNRVAMQSLLAVKHTMDQMTREELQNFKIDDDLGGTSGILMKKAIHRVYGEKANEVILGLKRCPKTAVNLVINRMKQKESEWKEAIKSYQRIWSDQDSRNYLKSLDHQGAVFKQKDYPLIRNKNLINQIESIAFSDRNQLSQLPSNSDPIGSLISGSLHLIPAESMVHKRSEKIISKDEDDDISFLTNVGPLISPFYRNTQSFTTTYGSHLINVYEGTGRHGSAHLALKFPDNDVYCNEVLEDAMSLVIHHVKRQTNSSKEDKKEMKFIVRSIFQDFFLNDHFPQSDDEEDDYEGDATPTNEEMMSHDDESSTHHNKYCNSKFTTKATSSKVTSSNKSSSGDHDESYSLFYANSHWYCLIRLYHLLVSRLDLLKKRGEILVMEAAHEAPTTIQAAEVLRLRKLYPLEPSKYYKRALSHIKDLLDGAEDIASYEDHLRDMFGIYAYPWFTMDRLIANIVKQLHTVACSDSLSGKLTSLYLTWNGNYTQKNVSRQNVKVRLPNVGISGPIKSRIERLSDEVEYSCEVMQAFAQDSNMNLGEKKDLENININNNYNNGGSTTNTSVNTNNNSSITNPQQQQQQSSTTTTAMSCINANQNVVNINNNINLNNNTINTISSSNNPNNNDNNNNSDQINKTTSNCFPMVIMKKSSLVLVRVVELFSKKRPSKNHQKNGILPVQLAQILQEQSSIEAKCYASYSKFIETPESDCKNWLDYIIRYFINLKINSPDSGGGTSENHSMYPIPIIIALCSRIRPVLLFRNVSKCVRALTNKCVNRKKLETLHDPNKMDVTEKILNNSNLADCHKLIMTIFKAELTKEELFRNTLNTDYMESSNRGNGAPKMFASPNTYQSNNINSSHKAYKINWSVGSYGIFYRHKESRPQMDDSAKRKRFHQFLEMKLRDNNSDSVDDSKNQNNDVDMSDLPQANQVLAATQNS